MSLASEDFQADFCPRCGCLIELQTLMNQIVCAGCKKNLSFQQFMGKPIKAHMKMHKQRDWVRKYVKTDGNIQRRNKTKMTIKEHCPKCNHPQLKYFTLQTRSADQGSTVFYQCENCNHSYSVNN